MPPEHAYQRLREMFGDEVPQVVTETERRRAKARENAAVLNAAPQRIRFMRARQGGKAGRGRPKPEHSERMRKWHASAPGQEHRRQLVEEAGPRLHAFNETPHGRARLALGKYLDHNPDASVEELKSHGRIVAERLGLTFDELWAGWRPRLRQRGHKVGPGRSRLSDRKAAVDRDVATAKRGPDGQLPRGFWPNEAEKLGMLRTQAESLRQWYSRQT